MSADAELRRALLRLADNSEVQRVLADLRAAARDVEQGSYLGSTALSVLSLMESGYTVAKSYAAHPAQATNLWGDRPWTSK